MSIALVWFRQDLRCQDNPALASACHHHEHVLPIFIKDDATKPLGGAQQWWLHHSLEHLSTSLKQYGLTLILRQGHAHEILLKLVQSLKINAVYWNHCYEPKRIEQDKYIKAQLKQMDVEVYSSNASLLFEPWNIHNQSGTYFKVFTPFWRHCVKQIDLPGSTSIKQHPKPVNTENDALNHWHLLPKNPNWALEFDKIWQPGEDGAHHKLNQFLEHLNDYKDKRDIPSAEATSRLSPHLQFGEISPAQIWRALEDIKHDPDCRTNAIERFLTEIGWREFAYHLLYHVPTLPKDNFNAKFDDFPWKNNTEHLKNWQAGNTGYPLIDAGMRELWRTGYMHNRVRMITASFLTKDLLIDWRTGADWFMDTLLDADLASNTVNWQWVAGCGVDVAPYFRMFNPILQSKKFDPKGHYIQQWVPELAKVPPKWIHEPWKAPKDTLGICLGKDYPHPIVNHDEARKRALQCYQALK